MEDNHKTARMFELYHQLLNGEIIHKSQEAARYDVSERSIQRDIEDIREYCKQKAANENSLPNRIVYDRSRQGYRLEHLYDQKFTIDEAFAVCKILLDSRAFSKGQMDLILAKLTASCVPKCDHRIVKEWISSRQFQSELQHEGDF